MRYRPYLGDYRIKHRVALGSHFTSNCIYCGLAADTREHTPSRVFLRKPFPSELSLVPACKKCNNSFSNDELYSWFLIKVLEEKANRYFPSDDERKNKYGSLYIRAKKEIDEFTKGIHSDDQSSVFLFKSYRLERVLEKLARSHAVFEVSEAYQSHFCNWVVGGIFYSYAPILDVDTKDLFSSAIDISNYLLPEVGSRIYDNIYTIMLYENTSDQDGTKKGYVFLDWTEVQEEVYRYVVVYTGSYITVHIVIDEFVYASILYAEEIKTEGLIL